MKIIISVIFFTYDNNNLYILNIKNKIPFIYLDEQIPLSDNVKKLTNSITSNKIKQVKTYKHDNTINIVYYTVINNHNIPSEFKKVNIINLNNNYMQIVNDALQLLKHDILTSIVGLKMLPEYFPFKDVQSLYETVLNKKLNRANFRTKFLSFNILKETSIVEESVAHRPAKMFTISNDNIKFKLN